MPLLPLNNRTHYHLVVEAKREQMSHAVHRLNGLYAQGFNRRHERRGHLFENRFSSWVIRDDEHLRATVAYVLENPSMQDFAAKPGSGCGAGRRSPFRLTEL